ncbi:MULTISPECIES: hypothetical protein [Snodgrassella]|uniref:phage baseplate plug family protein n=1 Tax=Snodgrassella TaxID=1193515 RepID=UPI0008155DAB|nr:MULTISPECIES: hypothetical protein [Snodgrassella]MCO6514764.1 hypothetical protein [Snodgrassella sp.]MCO6520558.1 hypothetical protein [Snodgrassella sp.]SCC09599.1 hypothetical protein GA0061082_108135 [Snodgrassella sp. R-53583]
MTTVTIPLEAYPNQTVSFVMANKRWFVSLFTRLGRLYASVENSKDGVIVHNRVCLNKTPITKNLVFIDTNGDADPTYTGLNGRFLLVYSDEA